MSLLRTAPRRFQQEALPRLGGLDWQRARVALGLGICGVAALLAWRAAAAASIGRPSDAGVLFFSAAIAGCVGLLAMDARSLPPRHGSWSQRPLGVGLLVTGVLSGLVATALQIERVPTQIVSWIWLLALAAVTCGVAMIDRVGIESRFVRQAVFVVIILFALALRLADVANVPAFISIDEAVIGNQSRLMLSGQLPLVFGLAWENLPALSFATHAATMAIFGDNLFGLRMSSVVLGTLCIALLYLLVQRLWGTRPAVLASVFLAWSAWHVHFSRAGDHQVQAPFVTLLAAYLLVRGLQDHSLLALVLAGFAVGASFELYYGARLAPVLLGVYLAHRVIFERGFLRLHVRRLSAFVIGTAVFLAPLFIVWSRAPDGFASRARVNILLPNNLSHSMHALGVDNVWAVIGHQLRAGLELLAVRGVWGMWPADHYADPTPLLDPWLAGLLAIGVIAVLARPRSPSNMFLAAWVLLGLLLSAGLTVDSPDPGRMLVLLPALTIVASLTLDEIWRGASYLSGRIAHAVLPVPILVVLGLALYANVDDYFRAFSQHQPATALTLASTYAATISDDYRIYMIGSSNWSFDNEVPRFLAPNVEAVNVKEGALEPLLEPIPQVKGAAFVVEGGESDAERRLAPIRAAYPGGVTDVVTQTNGKPAFVSYLVENSKLSVNRPDAVRE